MEEQDAEEENMEDQEAEDEAADEDSAGNKFSHSLDDDEDEEGQEDSKDSKSDRKKDNDDKDEEKDPEDGENPEEDLDKTGEDFDDLNDESKDKSDGPDENTEDFTSDPDADKKNDGEDELDDSKNRDDLDNDESKEQNPDDEPNRDKLDDTESKLKDDSDPDIEDKMEEGKEAAEDAAEDAAEEAKDSATDPSGATGGTTAAPEAAGETAAEGGATAAEGGAAAAEGGAAAAEGGAVAAEAGTAAAGTATAGGIAAAGPVILIVLAVILLIIIIIGVAGFFTTMPQFLWNRLKEFALSMWDGIEGYFIGMDEAGINKDDVIVAAQYLYDMGYDLVGMGFAESVEIAGQKDENGNIIEPTEDHPENSIISIDAPYLTSYLVAENRTYLVNNFTFNFESFFSSFFNGEFWSDDGHSAWGTGLINLDDNLIDTIMSPLYGIRAGEYFNVGEAIKGVKIDRDNNTMRIRRLNLELAVWKSHFDYTYYSLEGWSGRYGKPFELMITLHVATMAPDLVKEFALNKDLDAKVNVKLTGKKTLSGEIYVDGKSLTDIKDQGLYSDETREWLEDKQKDNADEIKTAMPYISSVTNHWFRNVYFEGTDSMDASGDKIGSVDVGVDDDADGLEDFNETSGAKTQKTRRLSSDDNVYESGNDVQVELEFTVDERPAELEGKSITIKGSIEDGMTQTKDAVRGVTNPTTKQIFAGEYYLYDGTIEKAKAIQAARRGENNGVKKEKVNLTKDSLQAFTILEGSNTLDAQFIYRDLKELVIEIGYFEREDFYEIEKQVLEWPVPEYIPAEWPNNEIEKQVIEYGSIIACDETIAASLGISLEDLQKLTGTEDKEDEEEQLEEELDMLKGLVFLGDDYIAGLEQNVTIEDAKFYSAQGSGPQYWLDNIATLPEGIGTVVIATGSNDPKKYESMKGLIDALDEKYENIQMYVIEVMHVTHNHESADSYNKLIDTYNSHVRNKCKIQPNATFIDASLGFITDGYLNNSDSTGRFLPSGSYTQWAKNIARKINENNISANDTDEQFVVDFLKAAKEVTKFVDENNFEYGSADFMPPRTNGSINEKTGTTDENGGKKISSDRMVSWALYKCGYKDQPDCGLCVGEDGDFISYCESKEWKRITSADEVQVGDIVFTGKLDNEGKKASHVFICAGEGKRYDCGSQERIRLEGSYSSYECQPFNEDIGSDFVCAYRVTGDGVINSGLKENLDVIAMGNGKVTELLDESTNLFSEEYIARSIYGDEIVTGATEDPVEGREQSKEGIRIKLTDNALRGYVLVMYGFDVDSSISVGQKITVGETIGKSLNSDVYIILIDKDKAVIEDVEDYIKVPKKTKDNSGASPQPYQAQPGDDVLLANMMHHEGCTNTFQGAAYGSYSKDEADRINMMTGYVLINRALVNFGGHGTTIREQLAAPGQYATAYVANNQTVECLECYANAKLCLKWDCDYVKNPDGEKMTRDVLYQSGWDQCTGGNSHPGQTCFWWVDDNRNNVPDVYSGAGAWYDEFFCYSDQYRSYR